MEEAGAEGKNAFEYCGNVEKNISVLTFLEKSVIL